ncbi:DUF5060 domain-containing protein [candidate division KSB1 bacterium]|nr:DUF5060 domain-containing protein [candidate division KSB1 bacterium]
MIHVITPFYGIDIAISMTGRMPSDMCIGPVYDPLTREIYTEYKQKDRDLNRLVVHFLILLLSGNIYAQISATVSNHQVPKYHVQTLELESQTEFSDPFTSRSVYAEFISPSRESYKVEAFYDGNKLWKIRFMPNETGQWVIKWSFDSFQGTGFFSCTDDTHPEIHGHLYVDPLNPRKLRFEDGTPLHWMSGKYLCIRRPFGTQDLKELSFPERLSTRVYKDYVKTYLDALQKRGLNGVLFKIQVLPLEYDLDSMDLLFLQDLDEILEYALYKGINVQLNLFDTWGKRKQNVDWTQRTPDHVGQLLLEPWNPKTFKKETEFYLRYIVARYAAFANIHWELWNEAERLDVSALEATRQYVSFIKSVDPYDLIISASEMYTGHYPLDVTNPHAGAKCYPDDWGYTHRMTLQDPYGYANNKPLLWNELKPYPGDYGEQERDDWFKACFWGNLTAGCAGTGELGWADIRSVPNQITEYHAALAKFLSTVTDINKLEPNDNSLKANNGTAWYCDAQSNEGIAYLFTKRSKSKIEFKVDLKAGEYRYGFYDPKTGEWYGDLKEKQMLSSGWHSFATPLFNKDIVFYIVNRHYEKPVTPVEWQNVQGIQVKESVILSWQTVSEQNNYGFNLSRRLETETIFHQIGFVPGHGTSTIPRHYTFQDSPPVPGKHIYKITQIDNDGTHEHKFLHITYERIYTAPRVMTWPNPAKNKVVFDLQIPSADTWNLEVTNVLGQLVHTKTLFTTSQKAFQYTWNAKSEGLSAGVYFYHIYSSTDPRLGHKGKMTWSP